MHKTALMHNRMDVSIPFSIEEWAKQNERSIFAGMASLVRHWLFCWHRAIVRSRCIDGYMLIDGESWASVYRSRCTRNRPVTRQAVMFARYGTSSNTDANEASHLRVYLGRMQYV